MFFPFLICGHLNGVTCPQRVNSCFLPWLRPAAAFPATLPTLSTVPSAKAYLSNPALLFANTFPSSANSLTGNILEWADVQTLILKAKYQGRFLRACCGKHSGSWPRDHVPVGGIGSILPADEEDNRFWHISKLPESQWGCLGMPSQGLSKEWQTRREIMGLHKAQTRQGEPCMQKAASHLLGLRLCTSLSFAHGLQTLAQGGWAIQDSFSKKFRHCLTAPAQLAPTPQLVGTSMGFLWKERGHGSFRGIHYFFWPHFFFSSLLPTHFLSYSGESKWSAAHLLLFCRSHLLRHIPESSHSFLLWPPKKETLLLFDLIVIFWRLPRLSLKFGPVSPIPRGLVQKLTRLAGSENPKGTSFRTQEIV